MKPLSKPSAKSVWIVLVISLKRYGNARLLIVRYYPYKMGRRPDKVTIDTLKEYYGEKP
jgi:uncharacterized Fe-S cluster-containing radical SAM superfamily enzyme